MWVIAFIISYFSGLISKQFHGFPDIHEVMCTGETLSSDSDLLTMILYTVPQDAVVAFVNLGKQDCYTSESFVSCEIDQSDPRRSRLKTLVADLAEGQTREFGCNLTAVAARGRMLIYSWKLSVHQPSESAVLLTRVLL